MVCCKLNLKYRVSWMSLEVLETEERRNKKGRRGAFVPSPSTERHLGNPYKPRACAFPDCILLSHMLLCCARAGLFKSCKGAVSFFSVSCSQRKKLLSQSCSLCPRRCLTARDLKGETPWRHRLMGCSSIAYAAISMETEIQLHFKKKLGDVV